jgi:ABC-type transport system substrate-binding protein
MSIIKNKIAINKIVVVIIIVIIIIAVVGAYYVFMQPSAPVKKTTLVIGIGTDIVTLDPADMTDNPSEMVCRTIYEGLVEFNNKSEIQPMLATSWEIKDNGLTYVFHLRQGIKFQDGTPFNSTAVKLNVERWLTGKLKRSSLYTPYIDKVEVIDTYTVAIHLKIPFGAFLHHLAHGAGLMISPKVIIEGKNPKDVPIGTGPYSFKEWVPGDHVTLIANNNYWKGKPGYESVTFKVVPDDSARERMLQSGELDVALRIPPVDVANLNKTEGIRVLTPETSRVIYIGMNTQKYPFNNTYVRQALNYAVDKNAIVKNILRGLGSVATSPLAPLTYGYFNAGGYPYNVTKAKELLKKAGWEDRDGDGILEDIKGNKFEVSLWTPKGRYVGDYEMAQAVQSYLAAVGVKVNLQVWEWASYLSETRKPLNETKVEMFLLGWAPSTSDGDWVLRPLFASWMWVPAGENRAFYSNKDVDNLINKEMTTTGNERLNALAEAQKIIVNDAPWIFLVVMHDTIGIRTYVKNLIYLPIEILLVKYATYAS